MQAGPRADEDPLRASEIQPGTGSQVARRFGQGVTPGSRDGTREDKRFEKHAS